MQYIAVAGPNNSGVKPSRHLAEEWARDFLGGNKGNTNVLICRVEAVAKRAFPPIEIEDVKEVPAPAPETPKIFTKKMPTPDDYGLRTF